MPEDSASEQMYFDFAEPEQNETVHGEQQIAVPVDHSLEEIESGEQEEPEQIENPVFTYTEFAKDKPAALPEQLAGQSADTGGDCPRRGVRLRRAAGRGHSGGLHPQFPEPDEKR